MVLPAIFFFYHRTTLPAEQPIPTAEALQMPPDPRIAQLNKFFDHYKCKEPRYVNEYLSSADKYQIPFMLLPAISIIESTCGQHQRFNNWWGYWSDTHGFTDVPAGIDYVSSQLAGGRHFVNLSIEAKLYNYGPHTSSYVSKVVQLINQIK